LASFKVGGFYSWQLLKLAAFKAGGFQSWRLYTELGALSLNVGDFT
jgi:hypothetical protein